MRGQFVRADGLVIPNNVTLAGADAVLRAAFRSEGLTIYAGLIRGATGLNQTSADVVEPTIGTNGYGRIQIENDATGWPSILQSNNEKYAESKLLTFAAVGGAFDEAIQRVMLIGTNTYTGTDSILAMSELLPAEITIDENTLLANRQFKYQFFL